MRFDDWTLVKSLQTSIKIGGDAPVSLADDSSKLERVFGSPARLLSEGNNAFVDFAVTVARVRNIIVIVNSTKAM